MAIAVPPVLYKYRHFSAQTVVQLCRDQLYYADPSTFNDPLDSKPCVEADCDVAMLERTVFELVRRRVEARMTAAARTIKYRGPKTLGHIAKHSKAEAQRTLDELAYSATNPDYEEAPPRPHIHLLASTIERELLLQYDKGVFSLAKRFDCPLMWSHYGEQHHGLCLGYAVPGTAEQSLRGVLYGGTRVVKASAVASMLTGDIVARSAVDEAVLLRKARDWRYEKEWRLLGPRGVGDSPLELVEVLFGTRCAGAVKHAVARALQGRDKSVKLYEMHEVHGTFRLKRRRLDEDELSASYPRRALAAMEGFADLDAGATS